MARDLEFQPLIGASFFKYSGRTRQDNFWTVLFLFAIASVGAGGFYGATHSNHRFLKLVHPGYLQDAAHCPAVTKPDALPLRRLLGNSTSPDTPAQPEAFLAAAGVSTALSAGGGAVLGLLGVVLFKHRPLGMVGLAVAVQVLLPLAVFAAAVAAGQTMAGLPFALLGGGLALLFWLYREQLALVARLLGLSARALTDFPGMIVAALGLQVTGFLLALPILAAMLLALSNGDVVRNPAVTAVHKSGCVGADGSDVLCCTWQPDTWVPPFAAWAALVLTWTSLLVATIRTYTVAGVTAQWYFAPISGGVPPRATLRSLGFALGPSFGSLCLASWVLAMIQMVRSSLQKVREQSEGSVLVALLVSCLDLVYQVLEMLTKFGVVVAAITGEGFWAASSGAVQLLTRNLLDTVGVWWLPGMVLQVTSLLLSLAWGVVAWGASYAWWGGASAPAAMPSAVVVGVLAALFGFGALTFVNGVLLSAVDATYVCYAMDRDAHAITRRDVHQVYVQLPSSNKGAPGGVVEQPGGDYAYGAAYGAGAGTPPPYAPPPVAQQQWTGGASHMAQQWPGGILVTQAQHVHPAGQYPQVPPP